MIATGENLRDARESEPSAPTALPTISIVVPVYNSRATLETLVRRVEETVSRLASRYEIILVNDGSRDGSWDEICRLATLHPCLRGLDLMRNYGQHNALLSGIRVARHEILVTMDDDLQHPPEQIPLLLEALTADVDVVYGCPEREQHGVMRNLASVMTKMVLQKSMGADVARHISAFRAFRGILRQGFSSYSGSLVSVDVLLTWSTTKFKARPVRHDARAVGTSNYTLASLVQHAFNMLTGFSVLPLQLASIMGFACTLFGIVILGVVLGRYFVEGGVPAGFPFLASIIIIFSGAQLLALGIIGEYLARMHFTTMEKPPYLVRRETQ
ncbi:MAG: glycosyltransferase family 2 protein [Armatimonadetes bacterium]|nr:glycosyltransferase family 2 protein [Armatimonadota bacterium]